jgi:hypothetical protein
MEALMEKINAKLAAAIAEEMEEMAREPVGPNGPSFEKFVWYTIGKTLLNIKGDEYTHARANYVRLYPTTKQAIFFRGQDEWAATHAVVPIRGTVREVMGVRTFEGRVIKKRAPSTRVKHALKK